MATSHFKNKIESKINKNLEIDQEIEKTKLETIEEEKDFETNIEHSSLKDFKQDTSYITSAGEPIDIIDPDS